jgi:hypothetical protein
LISQDHRVEAVGQPAQFGDSLLELAICRSQLRIDEVAATVDG